MNVFFGELSIQFLCSSFNQDILGLFCLFLRLGCSIPLMFYINPLSDIWFANIFYPIGCLFTVLMISFAVQKLFTLIQHKFEMHGSTYMLIFHSINRVGPLRSRVSHLQIQPNMDRNFHLQLVKSVHSKLKI